MAGRRDVKHLGGRGGGQEILSAPEGSAPEAKSTG